MTAFLYYVIILLSYFCADAFLLRSKILQNRFRLFCSKSPDQIVVFEPNQIEILRVLGKIDLMIDNALLERAKNEIDKRGSDIPSEGVSRATSVRVFEGRTVGGQKCFKICHFNIILLIFSDIIKSKLQMILNG